MNKNKILQQAIEIDRKLVKIMLQIVDRPVKPINLNKEKTRFFASGFNYQPKFNYDFDRKKFDELKKETEDISINIDNKELKTLYEEVKQSIIDDITLTLSIGDETFTQNSIIFYDKPSYELVKTAQRILKLIDDSKPEINVLEILNKVLNNFNIKFSINTNNINNNIKIKNKDNSKSNISQINNKKTNKNNKDNITAKKNSKETNKERIWNTDKSIAYLSKILQHFGFSDWKINIKNIVSKAEILVPDKVFNLKEDQQFTEKLVKRLAVHEIGTHILRAENGALQPLQIFKVGFPHYLATEEGLAAYNEIIFNVSDIYTLKNYALRTLATDIALEASFKDVFIFLKNHLSEDDAFTLTVRVKRGLNNTSMHGAFTKDYIYLQGLLDILKHLSKQHQDIVYMYYGKIALKHIELIKSIKEICNLRKPAYKIESIKDLI